MPKKPTSAHSSFSSRQSSKGCCEGDVLGVFADLHSMANRLDGDHVNGGPFSSSLKKRATSFIVAILLSSLCLVSFDSWMVDSVADTRSSSQVDSVTGIASTQLLRQNYSRGVPQEHQVELQMRGATNTTNGKVSDRDSTKEDESSPNAKELHPMKNSSEFPPDGNSSTSEDPSSHVPTGLRLAMIGDSLTRYQYLSLVYFLQFGHWEPPKTSPSIVVRRDHGSWPDFLNASTRLLAPNERCDCYYHAFEEDSSRYETIENRYYYDPLRDNMVVFINYSEFERSVKGHYLGEEVFDKNFSFPQMGPIRWEYSTWGDIFRQQLAMLSRKPQYVVINQGLWKHALANETVQDDIATSLKDLNMVGIFRTMTKYGFKRRPVEVHQYELDLCQKLDMCLNISWTFGLGFRLYFPDKVHFREPVYRRMNEQMFAMIEDFEKKRTAKVE